MVAPQRDDSRVLRQVVDSVPALLAYWDVDLRNRFASSASVSWIGKTPEQMHGQHVRDVLGEDVYARSRPHLEAVLHGEPQEFTAEVTDVAGAARHVRVAYVPDIGDEGAVLGFSVLVTDTTDRVAAELALAEHQARIDQLSDKLRVVSALSASLNALDPDGLQDAVAEAVLSLGFDGAIIILTDAQGLFRPRFGKGIFSVLDGATIARTSMVTSEVLRAESLLFIEEYPAYEHPLPEVVATGVHSIAAVPICSGVEVLGVLQAGWSSPRPLAKDDREVLELLAAVAGTSLRYARTFRDLRRSTRELAEKVVRDALTGLGNRRAADHLLLAARPGDALVMLDLDHFKQVNDAHGHAGGDEVLRALGRLLLGHMRQRDEAARVGGEEFLLFLPATASDAAEQLVQRLRETWAQWEGVTFSAGVSVVRLGETGLDTLSRADAALYAAKKAGRDRTSVA